MAQSPQPSLERTQNVQVKLPPNLNISGTDACVEWRFWFSLFEDYLSVTNNMDAPDSIKLSLLRNMMGPDALRIVLTLPLSDEKFKIYHEVIAAITKHVNPRTNVVFERFKFREYKQKEGQPFDIFLTECRQLIKTCNYKEEDEMMLDHIVCSICDKNTQEALLRLDDLTLDKVIRFCQTKEHASHQVSQMNNASTSSVCAISKNSRLKIKSQPTPKTEKFKCRRCQNVHGPRECPAFGKVCKKCGLKNHFAVSCMVKTNKRIKEVQQRVSSSDSECSFSCEEVSSKYKNKNVWFEYITIENLSVKCKLDTGADVSIMPIELFNKINEKQNLKLLKTNIKLESFQGNKVQPIGMINLSCKFKDRQCFENFVVVNCKSMLLGLPGCVSLNLIQRIDSVTSNNNSSEKQRFIQQNIDVFKGTGKVPGTFDIVTRNIETQICHPSPRIPNKLLNSLKLEFQMHQHLPHMIRIKK
ncbi:hypothetical protein ACJJTC_004458 [Scirpophaga incertulas]